MKLLKGIMYCLKNLKINQEKTNFSTNCVDMPLSVKKNNSESYNNIN